METSAPKSVFKRKEKKYRLDARQLAEMQQLIAPRMRIDDYGSSRVTSVYLDTPTRSVISRSLEKPRYKEKVRIRAYGDDLGKALVSSFADASAKVPDELLARGVFVELKKKYKGIVYKRRVEVSLAAALAWMRGLSYDDARTIYPCSDPMAEAESASLKSAQIAREIDAAVARQESLAPSMAVTCIRSAWAPREDAPADANASGIFGALRITFDEQLEHADLTQGSIEWVPTIAPTDAVMEVKCEGAYPLWLVEALSATRAYPASFSKYGRAATIEAASAGQVAPIHIEKEPTHA